MIQLGVDGIDGGPERLAVGHPGRGFLGGLDPGFAHIAAAGVVVGQSLADILQSVAGAIGGGGDAAPPAAPGDELDAQVVDRHADHQLS